MRGTPERQDSMFAYVSVEERVPANHPLRPIKAYADSALKDLFPTFERMYSDKGRPSIPPERIRKAFTVDGTLIEAWASKELSAEERWKRRATG